MAPIDGRVGVASGYAEAVPADKTCIQLYEYTN